MGSMEFTQTYRMAAPTFRGRPTILGTTSCVPPHKLLAAFWSLIQNWQAIEWTEQDNLLNPSVQIAKLWKVLGMVSISPPFYRSRRART